MQHLSGTYRKSIGLKWAEGWWLKTTSKWKWWRDGNRIYLLTQARLIRTKRGEWLVKLRINKDIERRERSPYRETKTQEAVMHAAVKQWRWLWQCVKESVREMMYCRYCVHWTQLLALKPKGGDQRLSSVSCLIMSSSSCNSHWHWLWEGVVAAGNVSPREGQIPQEINPEENIFFKY